MAQTSCVSNRNFYRLDQKKIHPIGGFFFWLNPRYTEFMKKMYINLSRSTPSSRNTSPFGFTVLELLVIIGIISILIALVFTGLNAARRQSNDERKVAALRPVIVELREYFNICRQYPVRLDQQALTDPTLVCTDLFNQQKTLRDIIPDAYDLNFDALGSKYHYVSLEPTIPIASGNCTNFHTWVELDGPGGSLLQQKSGKTSSDYASLNLNQCNGNQNASLVTNDDHIIDILK
jgi:type II secretory pathway pseudopilin PulG